MIKGSFVTVQKGSAGKRILLGFGSGAADLETAVGGYRMTAEGLRKLGSGQVNSGGNEMPGMVVPLAVMAATANPLGLVVVVAMKAYGELTGSRRLCRSRVGSEPRA